MVLDEAEQAKLEEEVLRNRRGRRSFVSHDRAFPGAVDASGASFDTSADILR